MYVDGSFVNSVQSLSIFRVSVTFFSRDSREFVTHAFKTGDSWRHNLKTTLENRTQRDYSTVYKKISRQIWRTDQIEYAVSIGIGDLSGSN